MISKVESTNLNSTFEEERHLLLASKAFACFKLKQFEICLKLCRDLLLENEKKRDDQQLTSQDKENRNFPLCYMQAIVLIQNKERESESLSCLYKLLRQLESQTSLET